MCCCDLQLTPSEARCHESGASLYIYSADVSSIFVLQMSAPNCNLKLTLFAHSLSHQYPVLRFAIIACSAHILRLVSKDNRPELGDNEATYQNKCLEILIPLLNNQDPAFQDEVVLATIVILRMSEQYEEFHVDRQFHLVPQAFDHFRAMGPSSTTLGGLREATFYSYVRADIRMAILGRCGTRLEMDKWPLDTTLLSDADWANQMTYFIAQAINLCVNPDAPGIMSKDILDNRLDEWRDNLPVSFKPYYYCEESDEELFPVVRLLCPWHGKIPCDHLSVSAD